MGIQPELPIKGVHMLVTNDLACVKVFPDPIVVNQPEMTINVDDVEENDSFPQCAITRTMSKKLHTFNDCNGLENTFRANLEESPLSFG